MANKSTSKMHKVCFIISDLCDFLFHLPNNLHLAIFPCIGFIIMVIIIIVFVVPLFKRKDIKLPGKSFE